MDMALLYPSTTTQSSSLLTVHHIRPILAVKPIVTLPQPLTTKHFKTRFTTITAATPGGAQGGMKEQTWTHEGFITESLSNGMFKVGLENGDVILGHVSGKIRQSHIRILPGDRVQIEVSRYDSSRGRITYRLRTDRAKGTP